MSEIPAEIIKNVWSASGINQECAENIVSLTNNNYSLLITGFKTKAQVKAFYDWYEGQGEQDAPYWFECRKQEGEIDVETMYVDMSKPPKWNGNTLEMKIKPKQLKNS